MNVYEERSRSAVSRTGIRSSGVGLPLPRFAVRADGAVLNGPALMPLAEA